MKTIEAFGEKWHRVWQEDDARPPDAESLSEAWQRLYGEPLVLIGLTGCYLDWGDADVHRRGDRLAVSSYPGNSAIYERVKP
jgi:hypothetical protein